MPPSSAKYMTSRVLRCATKTYLIGQAFFFESVTTIPFNKIQQVSTRMNLVSRFFSLYYVDVINGSQDAMSRLTIPGLSAEKAEQLKSLLINNSRCGNE